LTWRRFGVLIKGLPATSLTQTILRDTVEVDEADVVRAEPRFGPWDQQNYQLADLIDEIRQQTNTLIELKGLKSAEVEPYRRPKPKVRHVRGTRSLVEALDETPAGQYLKAIRDQHRDGGEQ